MGLEQDRYRRRTQGVWIAFSEIVFVIRGCGSHRRRLEVYCSLDTIDSMWFSSCASRLMVFGSGVGTSTFLKRPSDESVELADLSTRLVMVGIAEVILGIQAVRRVVVCSEIKSLIPGDSVHSCSPR